MKRALSFLLLAMAACGGDDDAGDAADAGPDGVTCAPAPGFDGIEGAYAIEVHPAAPDNVRVTAYPGLDRVSVDGGATAVEVDGMALADPRTALRWYQDDLVSDDGGVTFGDPLGRSWRAADFEVAGGYYAASATYPLARVDGDEVVELDPPFTVREVFTASWCAACVFINTPNGSNNNQALEVSSDGGASFTLAIESGAEDTLVARAQPIVWVDRPSRAFEWDGAALVEVADAGDVTVRAVHPTERLRALGVRRFDEAQRPLETLDGVTWTELDEALPAATAFAYDPDGAGFWLGTADGVLRCR